MPASTGLQSSPLPDFPHRYSSQIPFPKLNHFYLFDRCTLIDIPTLYRIPHSASTGRNCITAWTILPTVTWRTLNRSTCLTSLDPAIDGMDRKIADDRSGRRHHQNFEFHYFLFYQLFGEKNVPSSLTGHLIFTPFGSAAQHGRTLVASGPLRP